ncbi:hypothetical protein D3C76_1455700 [compost metagenome]
MRIDIARRRREDEVDVVFFELFAIFLQRARVTRQIVGAVKLHRVHEDRDHHHIGAGFGLFDQFHVAVMQITHSRDQSDTFTFLTQAANVLAQQRQGFND